MFLLTTVACSRNNISKRHLKRLIKCSNTWQYFLLDHEIKGKVLSYSDGVCGMTALASNNIIVTNTHDTLRVLELSCGTKTFAKLDDVMVTPVNKPDSAGANMDGKYDCYIKKTCYAKVSKVH
jgi:hypothetical protein